MNLVYKKIICTLTLFFIGLAATQAQPVTDTDNSNSWQDKLDSMFKFSGFGTIGTTHSDNKNADFTSTVFQPNGAGYTHSWSEDVDSKAGLQVNGNFTKNITGVLQVVSLQNTYNSYRPSVQWANLSYAVTPDFSVRYGRTVWPMFLRSETPNIGYGDPFVRNSAELMAEMPNQYSTGFDATYRTTLGAGSDSLQMLVNGKSDVTYTGNGNYLNVDQISGISNVYEIGDLLTHVAAMHLVYVFAFNGTLTPNVKLPLYSAGFTYSPEKWFVTGEYYNAPDPFYGRAVAYTFGGGYHINDFTPYFNYAAFREMSTGYGTFGAAGFSPIRDKQITESLGVRWDFRSGMDAKLQFDHIQTGDIAYLFPVSLVNLQGLPQELGGTGLFAHPIVNVVSIVVDFVF